MRVVTRLSAVAAFALSASATLCSDPAYGLPAEASACLSCHSDPKTAPDPKLAGFERSPHKDLDCTACHAGAAEMPHPAQLPAVDCGMCHAGPAEAFAASVHGRSLARGRREAPSCADCHGSHDIRRPGEAASSVSAGAITKTCGDCHASERITGKFGLPTDRVATFLQSFHGLAGRSGDLKVANCASCHGWHDVLPSSDPRSRVSSANIAKTCGQCHEGAGDRLSGQKIHVSLASAGGGSRAADFFRIFYLVLIPLTIGGMLLHNAADLLRKATAPKPLGPLRQGHDDLLLTPPERLQHAFLVVSFLLLAWSGFALKSPDSWWTGPLALLGGEEPRRNFHRVAAAVFTLLGLGHAAWLAFSRTGRTRALSLLPAARDLSDPLRLFLFNLGLSPDRPLLPRWSYIEKAEYLGLVWGSVVMVATGAVLVFHNAALAHLPLWVIEASRVIHYMEAILACLSILVWHFYWVIYDPEVYPMNWAWLTGRSRLSGRDGHG